jgi:hypothetical protein
MSRSGLKLDWKQKSLLRKGFRLPFRRRSEVNRGQDGTDQHYQQVDFHVTLRCPIAAFAITMQKAFRPKRASCLPNNIGGIKNG